MGSPLSPIITKIYMTEPEDKTLLNLPVTPICWFRKEDDTFVIINPTDDPICLLKHLNAQHLRMKFDVQGEKDNNKLQTSVYRKPTRTDQYLHFSSNHPLQVKRGIIATLARRAKNISSTNQGLEVELEHLRHVFINLNQYPANLVNRTIKTTLNPKDKPPRQQSSPFITSLPYVDTTSHHICRLLMKQANIDAVFQRGPSDVVYYIQCKCKQLASY
ncbi:uncharacterized protein LOC124286471 [Haliotis rubra]|uniref:uncharacterized protein LOC124286471 n=1 Tax=Haliotis rubra TaxID=36100 RepID=UPI001EE56BC4|nr:uncharacterized protein LOC124286471 [Haliotis rubra]